MKNKKSGLTLMTVLIAIAVLVILTGTITISTNHILKDTDKKEFIREYKLVEASTKDYIMRNSGVIDFEETTFDLSTISSLYLEQFEDETIVDNVIDVYIIDLEKIGVINATYGTKANEDENDVYLLSKETNTIYYKKGFEQNSIVYYKVVND